MGTRLKRLGAAVIDWWISCLPIMLLLALVMELLVRLAADHPIAMLLYSGLMLSPFIFFILRDVIFRGRSLGKRLFGLLVLDEDKLTAPSAKQCFLRNILFILYMVDVILLLATGKTLGDRIAHTVVLPKKAVA